MMRMRIRIRYVPSYIGTNHFNIFPFNHTLTNSRWISLHHSNYWLPIAREGRNENVINKNKIQTENYIPLFVHLPQVHFGIIFLARCDIKSNRFSQHAMNTIRFDSQKWLSLSLRLISGCTTAPTHAFRCEYNGFECDGTELSGWRAQANETIANFQSIVGLNLIWCMRIHICTSHRRLASKFQTK